MQCVLCNTENVKNEHRRNDILLYHCPICGEFKISGTLNAILTNTAKETKLNSNLKFVKVFIII